MFIRVCSYHFRDPDTAAKFVDVKIEMPVLDDAYVPRF
jgi:hypothetical protein